MTVQCMWKFLHLLSEDFLFDCNLWFKNRHLVQFSDSNEGFLIENHDLGVDPYEYLDGEHQSGEAPLNLNDRK